jgi:hypothetical protein
MCVDGFCPGCRELHVGKLHTRPQRARQVEAEVFIAADQASGPVVEAATVSLTMGGRCSAVGGARAYAASGGAQRSCICGRGR